MRVAKQQATLDIEGFMIRFVIFTGVMAAVVFTVAGSLSKAAAQIAPNAADARLLPDGPGKEVIVKACLSCHSIKPIIAKPGRSADDWADVISKMVGRGAVISDDDADLVIQYLSTHFGPDAQNGPAKSPSESTQPASPQRSEPQPDKDTAAGANSSNSAAPLNVNKASVDELESQLGFSRPEAELIIQYREKHGDFKTWQEVSSIPGIPVEKIKENQKRLVF